jgi:hypothetical protein
MNKQDFDFWVDNIRVVVNSEEEFNQVVDVLKAKNHKVDPEIYFDKNYNSICLFSYWSNYRWNTVRDKKHESVKRFIEVINSQE